MLKSYNVADFFCGKESMGISNDFLKTAFEKRFGQPEKLIYSCAPGRVNLIGEHTDYNEGFVLPVAIEGAVSIIGSPTNDRKVTLLSYDFNDCASFSLEELSFNKKSRWVNYVQGVADILKKEGYKLGGFRGVVAGDVPIGAGLSSSAAFEVAAIFFFKEMMGLEIGNTKIALLGRRAENDFVGVGCGIMDQYISVFGKKNNALLLDCRSLERRYVPLESSSSRIIVANTGVHHELAASEYNTRRKECAVGLKTLQEKKSGLKSLRALTSEEFQEVEKYLAEPINRRLRHVISENERTLEAAHALEEGDTNRFGKLMVESHKSLRDDYEVSCRELDIMVDIALNLEGIIGARMTGGGFGGCTVNLVKALAAKTFSEELGKRYEAATGILPMIYETPACDGAYAFIL